MHGKLNKNIGFSLIIFAFFFLFEPSYALIDPLPDFIGYTILCFALINLADINDKISVAFKAFRLGIILSILKIISKIILDKYFVENENTVGILLFVFIFAVSDILIMIPGYKALFEGLLHLGMFENGEAVYHKKHEKSRNITEKTYIFTIMFIIFKNVICSLPEFTTLQTDSSYEFVNIMRILSILVLMPISITWLIRMLTYFSKIKNDKPFIDSLTSKYNEKATESSDFFTGRVLKVGLYIFLTSFILSFDVYLENVNILSDIFFYASLILAAVFLRAFSKKWTILTILSVFGFFSSFALYLIEKGFFSRHYISAIQKDAEAYDHYYTMLVLYIVQALIFIAVSACSLMFIADIYKRYAVKSLKDDVFVKESNWGFTVRMIISAVLAIFSAIASIYYVISLPRFDWSWIYYYSGMISSAVSICFIVSVYILILHVLGEIKNNYKNCL